ncbi:transmembrane and TPR repeat-containing protein 4 isoform X2 [Cimex lectularius]|nr:transmembrane and TPR repeat-containing protein 4 isoform X2 [Cimex lectularius]
MFQRRNVKDLKPLLAAVLFSIHPVHTEAVAGIVGRADLLCAIFAFLAVICYAFSIDFNNGVCIKEVLLSSIFACIAMLSKEQGITALALCGAYDIIIVNSVHPTSLLLTVLQICKEMKICKYGIVLFSRRKQITFFLKREHHFMILRQIILFTAGSLMVYFRCWIMNFEAPNFQKIDNPASFADSIFTRFINYNYVYVMNTWITICPYWLCFDWSMGCIPLIMSLFDLRILFVLVYWLFCLALLNRTIRLGKCSLAQQIIMAIGFVVISFFPASNILFRVGFVIAERNLYLPSVGFCMLVTIGIEQLYLGLKRKAALFYLLGLLLLTNVYRCHQRSLDWSNEKVLFFSGLKVCPLNAKVHYNVAKSSFNVTTSVKHYREAIRLNPEYEQALNNLANVLRDNGDIKESEELLRKAIKIRPNFATAWMNLGIVLAHMRRYDEALDSYKMALSYRKNYPDCYYNLGNLYLSQKKHLEAYVAWREATNQKPKHSIAWNNMIVLMDSLGESDRAEELALEALEILPDDPNLHFNLANTLGKKSQYEKAEEHFKQAIKLKPQQALFHTNLGVLYHRWKKYKKAEDHYLKALNINPDQKNVEQNLKSVQKQLLKTIYSEVK